jgi:two-component system sensor histidine kinase PhoQ
MNSSIQFRLVVSASIVLFCFLGLAGFALDRAYQKGAQTALNERLQIHLYSILGKAELSKSRELVMPTGLSEPRFSQIGSGLYAYIFSDNGDVMWRSSSSTGEAIKAIKSMSAGEKTFVKTNLNKQSNIELHYKAILESPFEESAHL